MKKLVLVAILAMVVMAVSFGGVFAQVGGDVLIDIDNSSNADNYTDVYVDVAPEAYAATVNSEGVVVNQSQKANIDVCAKGVAAAKPAATPDIVIPDEVGGGVTVRIDNSAVSENDTDVNVDYMPIANANVIGSTDVIINQDQDADIKVCAVGVAAAGDVCVDLDDCCCDVCDDVCDDVCEVATTVPKTADVASLASVVALVVSGLGATVVGRKVK